MSKSSALCAERQEMRLKCGCKEVNSGSYPVLVPIPVTAWYKASVFGRSLAEIAGYITAGGGGMSDVCRECCVLSGGGLCVGLIACPLEFY
jgi:hypothetical protein